MTLQRLRPYAPLVWLAPAVVYLLAFSIYPLIYSLQVSFTVTTAGPVPFTLANFTRLLRDRLFFTSLGQTAVYTLAALVVEFLLAWPWPCWWTGDCAPDCV